MAHKNYIARFQDVCEVLLEAVPPAYMIEGYLTDCEDDCLADWFLKYNKISWSTGIDAIEAVEYIINGARGNANLDENWEEV